MTSEAVPTRPSAAAAAPGPERPAPSSDGHLPGDRDDRAPAGAQVPAARPEPDEARPDPPGPAESIEERLSRMMAQLGDRLGDRVEDALAAHGRMRGLVDAVLAVAQESSLPATLRRIAEQACRLAEADYGAIGVLGPDGRITDLVHVGIDAAGAARIGGLPAGHGLLGKTLRENWALRVDDVARHPEAFGFPPWHPVFGTFLGTPIAVRGVAFGSLFLGGKRGGGPFTRQDEDLVTALAATAAVAIDNARLREESRRQQAWHTASGEIGAALVTVDEPWAALDLVARRARQVTSACLAAIVLPGAHGELTVTNADGQGADDLRGRSLPVERSPLVETLRTGRARLVASPDLDVLFGRGADALALSWVMVVPMAIAGRPVGGLLLGAPLVTPTSCAGAATAATGTGIGGIAPFSDLDLRMGTAFAGQAALTLELTRLQRDRERLAVFEDRDRIARDLHDVVIQRLFATGLQLQGMSRALPPPVANRVGDAVAELDRAISDLRHTIFSLSSPAPGGSALGAEIDRIVSQAEHSLGLRPTVQIEGSVERIPTVIHPHLLAVLRESLSNIARHSRASQVEILVRADKTTVLVEVRDDGVGPGTTATTSGLTNLRRRAQDLGGHMEFGPGPGGRGSRVRWQVPTAERSEADDWAATATPPGLPRP